MRSSLLAWLVVLFPAVLGAQADPVPVRGRIVDPSGLPLPGVIVTLRSPTGAATATTDLDGRFVVDGSPGDYVLTAAIAGFEPASRPLRVAREPIELALTLQLAKVEEEVAVGVEQEGVFGDASAGAPAMLTRAVIDNAMVPNNTVDDLLPLLPNVVRGPDGLISVAGARAPQGQLLIDGLSQNDPVLGGQAVMLPLDPVGSVQVRSRGYGADYGRATGGITEIAMRPAADVFRFTINSLDPRLRFIDGGVRGIEAWEPNAGASGPLVKGRLWFAQALDYRWERFSFDTLSGREESRDQAMLSWSGLEAQLAPTHRLSAWAALDPQITDQANVSAFTLASALPQIRRGGWRAAGIDRIVLGDHAALEAGVETTRLRFEVNPYGELPYVMGHDRISGSYFNRQGRNAGRLEAYGKWTIRFAGPRGAHVLKVGGHLGRLGFEGFDESRRVTQLRSDGATARTIDFAGPTAARADGLESSTFVQDGWELRHDLTVDLGVRYDGATIARAGRVAPRAGVTWKLGTQTTISGAAGAYGDKVMLATAAFAEGQARTITEFDAGGVVRSSRTLHNRLDGPLEMPSALAWHVQIDRQLGGGFAARIAYQEQRGRGEPVVAPGAGAAGELLLRSDGVSRARSLETTAGYRRRLSGQSVYVSYVRASAIGSLNDFGSIEGAAKTPFVQADGVGPLAADVPHRLLAWGLLKLPSRVTVAPFLEVRSGFPFSPIDDDWRYVGERNGARFPPFASLDLFVNKIVKLPGGLPLAKVGLKLFNLTGSDNARDIQADIARPDYGTLYNPIRHQIRGVFELLWGQK